MTSTGDSPPEGLNLNTASTPVTQSKDDHIRRFHADGCVLIQLHALGDILPNGARATGKEPVARGWQRTTASPPLTECLTWANYGILPGPSKRAVLDVEPAGLETFPREKLPKDALVVSTPSGGYHVPFDLEAGERALGQKLNKKIKLGTKAELHSWGTQVVGPGSHAYSEKAKREGDYEIEQDGKPISDETVLRSLLAPFLKQEVAGSADKNGKAHQHVRRRRRTSTATPPQHTEAWATAALSRELAAVASARAGDGKAHATMMSSGARLGQIVGAGHLDRESVIEQLVAAATNAGWDEREARRCANDAVEFGGKNPRGPAQMPEVEIVIASAPRSESQLPVTETKEPVAAHQQPDVHEKESAPVPPPSNSCAAPQAGPPEDRDIATLDDALALLEDPNDGVAPLFKRARALSALSVADQVLFLQQAKQVHKKALAKTELARAIDDHRKTRLAKERKKHAATAQLQCAAIKARKEHALKSCAAATRRSEIQLFDSGDARDPKAIHDDTVAALVASNSPERLFIRCDHPVRIGENEEGQPGIVQLEEKRLQAELIHRAIFIGKNRQGDPEPVDPPAATIRTLIGCGNLPFRKLTGIVRAPLLCPDGSILSAEGYDIGTGLFYSPEPGLVVPSVSERPTEDEVREARESILEIFNQFPFVDEASRANAVGLLLTSFLQPVVDDHRPLAATVAPEAGSGKGLIATGCCLVVTGRVPRSTRMCREEELEKKIAHLLAVGTRFILIDNAKRRIESETLESTLTLRRFSDRTFGHNDEGFDVPQDATWCVNGNNLELGSEIARRSYLIELDAGVAHPEDRAGPRPGEPFKRLPEWVKANRGRLIWAVLTISRAWWVAGQPMAKLPPFGNFERWQGVVGGVLEVAGIPHFLGNRKRLQSQQDEEHIQWDAFLHAAFVALDKDTFLTNELAAKVAANPALRDGLPDELAGAWGKPNFTQMLGLKLKKKVGRRFGKDGLRVIRLEDDTHVKVGQWEICMEPKGGVDEGK